ALFIKIDGVSDFELESNTPSIVKLKRKCTKDDECTLEPRHHCECPPCRPTLRRSVTKAIARRLHQRYSRAMYSCMGCKGNCKSHWVGSSSECIKNLCTTIK
ncbi:hypothetical protein KKF84_16220, partial [Myxococcota bacterium]|nr:hypothetical protein [Myxococcota bacterium]MBU1536872.1 hypothetical protein [Myxococcota bacterium]